MNIQSKDKQVKGNTFNIGFVNNTAQANIEINNNLSMENEIQIKTGIMEVIKTYISNKTFRYIGESKYNKAKYSYELQRRIDNIPNEYIIQPRLSIIGPVLDNLIYNLDEKQIREMFTNILVSEIDNRKQNDILPAYVEIIKQLSKNDAKLLNSFKEMNKQQLSICITRLEFNDKTGYIDLDTIIVDKTSNGCDHTIIPKKIVLENLERLNIIKLSSNIILPKNNDSVKNAFEYYKSHTSEANILPNTKLTYTDGSLTITDFGWNFINICCSQ